MDDHPFGPCISLKEGGMEKKGDVWQRSGGEGVLGKRIGMSWLYITIIIIFPFFPENGWLVG